MNNQTEDTRGTIKLLEQLAVEELQTMIQHEHDDVRAWEILDIFNSSDSVSGGEYLGGNGQPTWSDCKGKDSSDTPHDVDVTDDVEYLERAILALNVTEHQSSIETNGAYNVRQLARWKHGYNHELAIKAREDNHRKLLEIRVTDAKKRKLLCPIATEKKKAKMLARLQKRFG